MHAEGPKELIQWLTLSITNAYSQVDAHNSQIQLTIHALHITDKTQYIMLNP